MSTISGKKREQLSGDFAKKVGLAEVTVLAINPSIEEYKDRLGMELKEDSKAVEYLGESEDGDTKLRVDVWLEEVKTNDKFKVTFFLENREKENKDATKKQYINAVGVCSWADDPNNLPKWFAEREYRVAYVGEEELYNFLRTWLGNLDLRDAESTLQLEWKKLMKGNVKDLRDQINGEWCTSFLVLTTIKTVEKEGEIKTYQSVFNKAFTFPYVLKQFRTIDYDDATIITRLKAKTSKELKTYERFVLSVKGEYGFKDIHCLKDLKEFNENESLVTSDSTISEDDTDY
jgi:hypothetical protein